MCGPLYKEEDYKDVQMEIGLSPEKEQVSISVRTV